MKRFVFVFLISMTFTFCFAQKVTIDGIVYGIHDDFAAVHGTKGDIEEAVILSSVNYKGKEYPVLKVGYGSESSLSGAKMPFDGCKTLKKVSIPNSVTEIGIAAFRDCMNLREIILPDNPINVYSKTNNKGKLTITSAFRKCNAILTVKCQNGSFPAYILGAIPDTCPFILSLKYQK